MTLKLKILYIRFDKVNGFISVYDGTRSLVSFSPVKLILSFTIGLDILYVKKRYYIYFFLWLCNNQNWFIWFFISRKKWLCIMFSYLLSQFWIKIKITTNMFLEKCLNQLGFFRWGTDLYMLLFLCVCLSVCLSVTHHISETVHLIIIFGTQM